MPVLKFLRYLRGYVCFIVTGSFPQRIINSCCQKKIPLWDIFPSDNCFEAKTYADSYKKLRKIRKNRNPKIRIKEKYGICFKLNRYRKRAGIFAGICFSIFFIFFLTSRIWVIDVNCEDVILKNRILNEINLIGIQKGSKIKEINIKESRKRLMILDNNIAWDGLNIKGCKLKVEVNKVITPPSKKYETTKYADLLASSDGQILYCEIEKGKLLCQKGDTVEKGELLVSGKILDNENKIFNVYSSGKIYALCQERNTTAVKKEEKIPVPSGKKRTRYSLLINKKLFKIPDTGKNSEEIRISENIVNILPGEKLSLVKEVFQPVKYNSFTYNYNDLKSKAISNLDKIKDKDKDFKFISSFYSENEDNDFFYMTETVNYIKNIAITREFY